ncbi:MAG: 30S ribosomal protein S24e [Thermoplasmata archaeon]|jgi:small subunit ribosomal protein S24e|nr:30S ribosomal protein S24e [Thermoplasmata archaeon]
MEIEIVAKQENEVLDRVEVRFKAVHAKEGTPKREDVRQKLASLMKAPAERVVVDSMDSEFGKSETMGYAKVYKTKEAAMKYERQYVLVRNKLKEKKVKEKKAAPAKQEKKAK